MGENIMANCTICVSLHIPISIISKPQKTAYETLPKKINNGSTQIAVFHLMEENK